MLVADYKARLARSLGVEIPLVTQLDETVQDLSFPRARDLTVPLPAASVDLLDFLSLGDCELQAVIARKNSSLGKVAGPSAHLVAELNFLQVAESCVNQLGDDQPALASALQQVVLQKQSWLAYNIWRATLAGDEFRSFWRNRDHPAVPDPILVTALKGLEFDTQRWLGGDYAVDSALLEARLQVIQSGQGGSMLGGWRHISGELGLATGVAKQRLAQGPLCRDGIKSRSAEIFERVVTRYFVAGVQLQLAKMNAATWEIETSVAAIEALLSDAETPVYTRWRQQRTGLIQSGRAIVREHVKALEPLFRQCGIL